MIIKIHMDGHIKSMSERKFYGIYYHSLIRHSAEQYRLFSGRSSNTEKEEAVFNTFKKFTNLTSNDHPDNVICNALVRIQAHQILTANEKDKERNDETFANLYQPIKQNLSNTIISFEWIEKHYSCYQTLQEQIAHYLICDTKCWKKTAMGILSLDHKTNKNLNMKIHNFRSSTTEEVNNYLRRCWNKFLENPNTLIPAFKIKMLNGEKWKTEKLTTWEYFRNKFLEEDQTDDNASVNNSDAIRSNNVKIYISSENNHSLIWNDTIQEIDVFVIPKENCDKTISTNNLPLEEKKSLKNYTEIPFITRELKTKSTEMLLASTPVTKNKETNHNQGSDHIISTKPILQPEYEH